MSNYEAEAGEWILPAAEVARVKKVLRDAHNDVADAAYGHAKRFWKEHATQSPDKYKQAMESYADGLERRRGGYGRVPAAGSARDRAVADAVRSVLSRIHHTATHNGGRLRGATRDDMAASGWAKKTNRDSRFDDGDGVTVHVDDTRRRLRYEVEENNHAVDRARAGLIGQTLFAHLGRVKWTRGTGGTVHYISEYDVDEFDLSRGASPKAWYGPHGATMWKRETGAWPAGSPQSKQEAEKLRKAEARRQQAARKRDAAKSQKALQAKAAGSQFCGAIRKDGSGLCGRRLNGGKCPDHGTAKSGMRIGVTSAGTVVPASQVAASDPMGTTS